MRKLVTLFRIKRAEHRTTDGGILCPYPGMTDDDLRDFETHFNIPSSFKRTAASDKLAAAKRYASAVQERMLKEGILSPIRNKGKENGNAET